MTIIRICCAAVCLVFCWVSSAQAGEGNWPRLLRVIFRAGTTSEKANALFAPYGHRKYQGDPTPKKLLAENSFELEIVDTSREAGGIVRYIELAVPAGQEDAWTKVFQGAPEVASVIRPDFTSRAPNPADTVPASAFPLQSETETIPLDWLKAFKATEIIAEVDRFMTMDLLAKKDVQPNFHIRNAERRRVMFVTNARDLFTPKGWQNVVYDITILENQGVPALLVSLQAKWAAGNPPTHPPLGNYRELSPDENAELKLYSGKVENALVARLRAWHPSTP